jgi:TolB-like protein
MSAPDIFLSYNREDQVMAKLFADSFAHEGMSVWWDVTLRSGEAYDRVTEEALRTAKAVVVLWSRRSVDSRWVRAEASIADENGTLAPAKIEACDLPVMFRLTQTADLSHWQGESADSVWLTFLGDVRRMVGPAAMTASAANSAPALAIGGRDEPSKVAVLPVAHRGDDDMDLLAEDLTEDITRELARNRFFEVIAAGTMKEWHGKAAEYREMGRELEARYLIESKLQRAGENVRLTLQLIDAGTAKMVWSHRFFRKAADIAKEPDEFPLSVAADLGERIAQFESNRAMAKAGPYSAWEHALRAMALAVRQSSDSMRRAAAEARSAIAAAPDLGFAHAVLATALAQQDYVFGAKILDDGLRSEIQAHVQRALQLEGDNPTIIAWLVGAYQALGDSVSYLPLAIRAVELEPELPRSHHMLGQAYMELGRTTEAIAALLAMDRLTAFVPFRYLALADLGRCYHLEDRLEEAEAVLDRSLALFPDFGVALKWRAIVAAQLGKKNVAQAAVRRLREVEPALTIEQHVGPLVDHPYLADRSAPAVATLRRLWEATEGETKPASREP